MCHLDVEPLYLRQHAAITNILNLADGVIIYVDWYKIAAEAKCLCGIDSDGFDQTSTS